MSEPLSQPVSPRRNTDAAGLFFGLGAYGIWGVFPGFFPMLQPAGAGEILAHRVVWTLVFMVVLLVAMRRLGDLRGIDRRTWTLLACASALISTNWLVYIYAVNSHQVVDAALGYYINPLVSVLIGVAIFGERLNRPQMVALLIAVAAVVLLAVGVGGNPMIAMGLALSFGLYGAVKKVVRVDPRVSVTVETAIAAPLAVLYLAGLQWGGTSQFANHGPGHVALMLLCGPVTAVPLLFFAAAAQRLALITIGLLQYLTPSMQLTWGLVIGNEPMSVTRWTGFALIWFALAIFTTDGLIRAHRGRTGSLQAS